MPQHMQIGEVAQQTGLSLRTIRYYEEMGLIVPSARSSGGFRLYTESDVGRLQLIKRMKPLEFSLDETKDLLGILDQLEGEPSARDVDELVDRLAMYFDAAQAQVSAVREQLAIAEGFAGDLQREISRQKRQASSKG